MTLLCSYERMSDSWHPLLYFGYDNIAFMLHILYKCNIFVLK